MTSKRHTADSITDDDLAALYENASKGWRRGDRWKKRALAAEKECKQLLAELGGRDEEARERWVQEQLNQTGIRAMDFRNGATMDLEPAREMVAHWVGAARAMLGDAPNYSETPVSMEVKVAEGPERFAFTLQRVGKLTPHQARQQAEERAEQAEAALEHVRGIARRLTAHAVGFQDALDDTDRDPWARTVGTDISELCAAFDGVQRPGGALNEAERTMLAYALDQAQEKIWSEDGFTDDDQAAVDSLRRLAAEPEESTTP